MFFLFDLDGTLTDTNGLWLDVDLTFAHRRGLTVTQEYTDFVAHSIFTTAADFTKTYYSLPDTPQQIMDEWLSLAHDAYATCRARPGVQEFLSACRRMDIPMAIVTASMPELCRAALEHLGLTDYFRFVLYAQEVGLEKRHPEIWTRAAALAGCTPRTCVVFDDSPLACAAARQAGCVDIGIRDPLFAHSHQQMAQDCTLLLDDFTGHTPDQFIPLIKKG